MNETLKEILKECFTSNLLDVVHRDLLEWLPDNIESFDVADDRTLVHINDVNNDTLNWSETYETYDLCVKITEIYIKHYIPELTLTANNMEAEIQFILDKIPNRYYFGTEAITHAWGNLYNEKWCETNAEYEYIGKNEIYELGENIDAFFDFPETILILNHDVLENLYTGYIEVDVCDLIDEYLCDSTIIDLVENLINSTRFYYGKIKLGNIIPIEDVRGINIHSNKITIFSPHETTFIFENGIHKEIKKLIGE